MTAAATYPAASEATNSGNPAACIRLVPTRETCALPVSVIVVPPESATVNERAPKRPKSTTWAAVKPVVAINPIPTRCTTMCESWALRSAKTGAFAATVVRAPERAASEK